MAAVVAAVAVAGAAVTTAVVAVLEGLAGEVMAVL
jgi:hypothetical protein